MPNTEIPQITLVGKTITFQGVNGARYTVYKYNENTKEFTVDSSFIATDDGTGVSNHIQTHSGGANN